MSGKTHQQAHDQDRHLLWAYKQELPVWEAQRLAREKKKKALACPKNHLFFLSPCPHSAELCLFLFKSPSENSGGAQSPLAWPEAMKKLFTLPVSLGLGWQTCLWLPHQGQAGEAPAPAFPDITQLTLTCSALLTSTFGSTRRKHNLKISEEDSVPCDELSKEPRETWQDVGGLIPQKVTTANCTVSYDCVFHRCQKGL